MDESSADEECSPLVVIEKQQQQPQAPAPPPIIERRQRRHQMHQPQQHNPTQQAMRDIGMEIGEQALGIMDELIKSDAFKERLKTSVRPLIESIIDATSANDDVIRTRVSQILRPYRDQYQMVVYAGAGLLALVMFLLTMILSILVIRRR